MFSIAFLQELGNGRLRHEEAMLKAEFERRGVSVVLYTLKQIHRRNLPLSNHTFIAGDIDAMHGAMQQLNIPTPIPNDYPESLHSLLGRRIWKSTLGEIEQQFLCEDTPPLFIKPCANRKSFTGKVIESYSDFMCLHNLSKRQKIWCSEIVSWLAEFRVYVIDRQIVGIDFYAGNSNLTLDLDVINKAVLTYYNAPSAYSIDFGILETGQTALIECNDGYALGAYHLTAATYTNLLISRWSELLQSRKH